jgi:predicted phage terminase large subunit-like protein
VIEDKASGTQLIQDLRFEGLLGITEYKPPPGTDKIMRMHAQTAMFENGLVFLPRMASWLSDYVHELTGFPGTRHDDQVDSTTQFLDYIRGDHALEEWIRLGQLR